MAAGKSRGSSEYPFQCLSLSRRRFLKKAGVCAAASIVCARTWIAKPLWASVPASRPVRVGIFGPSHCAAPFVFSKLKGFFQREKLSITLVNYPEMALIARDLISGKLDFGQLIVPLALALHTGAKPFAVKTPVVITQIGGTNGAALMVRNGTDIRSPSDFRGRTMANHSKLSVHYLINMMFLERQGLDPAADVKFSVVGLDECAEAMKRGGIDSFVMPEPNDALVEFQGIGGVYMLSKYIWPNHPCCALVARRDFFEKDRELATAVTRIFTKGGLTANEAGAREDLVDLLRGSPDYRYDRVPKAVLMSAFTPGRSDFYPFPFKSSGRLIAEIMKKYGLLRREVDEKKVIHEVFLSDLSRSVMKDLGASPPESDYRAEKILGSLKEYAD